MKFAQRLTDFRKTSGLSQRKFAEMVGVPQTTWSGYESGRFTPPMKVIMALEKRGYKIPEISNNYLDLKSSLDPVTYTNVQEILKIEALKKSPEIPLDDALGENVKEGLKKLEQPGGRLLLELEKIVLNALEHHIETIHNHESRLSAIEERLQEAHVPPPLIETEYPSESGGNDSTSADPEPEYGEVPFHDGVAAGPPISQSEDESLVVDVPLKYIKTELGDYYALRVIGNSMIYANIPDGSLALIKKSDVPQHGKIQVVRLDDRVTLKRMRQEDDHSWTLCYDDGTGRTIPLGDDNHVQGDFVIMLPPHSRLRARGE